MTYVNLKSIKTKHNYARSLNLIIFLFQIGCFIYSFCAPDEVTRQDISASICELPFGNSSTNDFNTWYSKDNCENIVDLDNFLPREWPDISQLVFMMELPLNGVEFSSWQQHLLGQLRIGYLHDKHVLESDLELSIDARLAYSNKVLHKNRTKWEDYAHSQVNRYSHPTFYPNITYGDGYYSIAFVPLFELGCLHNDFYLLNIRLHHNISYPMPSKLQIFDMTLHVMHTSVAYAKGWIVMKTTFFVLALAIMIRFWNHLKLFEKSPSQLQKMLLIVGFSLLYCDLPLQYLALYFEMPYMLLVNTFRQGLFYCMLLLFWLMFTREHILIGDESFNRNSDAQMKQICLVLGCFALPIFVLCERFVQYLNPFNTLMFTKIGKWLTLIFTSVSVISFCIFAIIIAYSMWLIFRNISARQFKLPAMYSFSVQQYGIIIFRIKCIMISTIIFAELTAIYFVFMQIVKLASGWDQNMRLYYKNSSILNAGVIAGMWDLYVCGMLLLYTPAFTQEADVEEGDKSNEIKRSNYQSILGDVHDKYPLLSSLVAYKEINDTVC